VVDGLVGDQLYDRIGVGYAATRGEDPRIASAIDAALGDARTVLNVGAGVGSYEPRDRELVAVEPSQVMIRQRPPNSAPVVCASAEALPFGDASFDAAMAVLSDHHWRDRLQGIRALRRVARNRVVLFNADPAQAGKFWLTAEYLPQFVDLVPEPYREPGHWEAELSRALGDLRLVSVPVPHDCRDGFYGAFWRRPAAYLEPAVRRGISVFAQLDRAPVRQGLARLRSDLETGSWEARHAGLLDLDELDLGYRLVIAEITV